MVFLGLRSSSFFVAADSHAGGVTEYLVKLLRDAWVFFEKP